MSVAEIVVLVLAGFFGGIANAVAGGGTFFTFAAMVAFGLPALAANATSAVSFMPGSIAIGVAYRDEIIGRWRKIIPYALVGTIGGIAGALLLIHLGDAQFRRLVPWLIGGATLLFAFSDQLGKAIRRMTGRGAGIGPAAGYAIIGCIAIYGGFFGAGMGIMLLAGLALVEHGDFHAANATKNIVATVSQTVAVVLFVAGGLVHWPQAITTMLAGVLGGYVGVILARRMPLAIVRGVVVLVGAALTLVFALR